MRLRLENVVDEEQIGEQRAKMDGSVQVVNHLRTDAALREYELDGHQRLARIGYQHRAKRFVARGRLQIFLVHRQRITIRESGKSSEQRARGGDESGFPARPQALARRRRA